MTQEQLARRLQEAGCPAAKSLALAAQLHKRALQLAARTGRTYEQALTHLLALFSQQLPPHEAR